MAVARAPDWMPEPSLDRLRSPKISYPACGGSAHGNTADLAPGARADLAAFLESL